MKGYTGSGIASAIALILVIVAGTLLSHSRPANADASATPKVWGTSVDGLAMSLKARKSQYTVSDPIFVDLHVKNVGSLPVSYAEQDPAYDFTVSVRSSDGLAIPMTRFGRAITTHPDAVFRNVVRTIPPGGELVYHFWLNMCFDLSMAGGYNVAITRHVNGHSNNGGAGDLVASNDLAILVIPDRSQDDPDDNIGNPTVSPPGTSAPAKYVVRHPASK